MYGNSFFNPYMYQPYQSANLVRGLGGIANTGMRSGNIAASAGRSLSGASTALSGFGRTNTIGSLGKGILSKFSFSGFLNGASKTLNVVNQAIPIYYQVKPVFNNAKTMFKIMGAVKDEDKKKTSSKQVNVVNTQTNNASSNNNVNINNAESDKDENPTFFI